MKLKTVFVGYTGKTGSVIFNSFKSDNIAFDYLVNSENFDEYLKNYLGSNQVILDFSHKNFILNFLESIKLKELQNIFYITGVTGFNYEEIKLINEIFIKRDFLGFHFPNFSVGINLINKFINEVSKYFFDCEIIEAHHQFKKDKPSGTSLMSKHIIKEEWIKNNVDKDINIHSIRLPSLIAHQNIIFTNNFGEVLEIKHHSLDRKSFYYGTKLVFNKIVNNLNKLNLKPGFYFNLNIIDFLNESLLNEKN
ncbi:MAG: 4-hydroxy-tetrahydrodipicolinate reductase [bacterium]|jgi:4-hydroxy-tetrahydrodipicolinate reductase